MRNVCLSAPISGEQSMKVMEEYVSQANVEGEKIASAETDD